MMTWSLFVVLFLICHYFEMFSVWVLILDDHLNHAWHTCVSIFYQFVIVLFENRKHLLTMHKPAYRAEVAEEQRLCFALHSKP